MKKSLLALAVLGAFAGVASAQSSVTLYGTVDLNGRYVKADGQDRRLTLSQDGINSSQLGFRGVEDLGGGLKAGFNLLAGVNADTGTTNSKFFNRRATVSLFSNMGELRLGRDYTPTFWNLTIFDAFGTNGLGSSLNVRNGYGGTRQDNSIGYFLPGNLGGFYGQGMVSASEGGTTADRPGRYIGGRVGFAAGPFDIAGAYAEVKMGANATLCAASTCSVAIVVPNGKTQTTYNVGGSWDFGFMKLMGIYDHEKFTGFKEDMWSVSGVVPFGQAELHVGYDNNKAKLDGFSSQKIEQFKATLQYNVSKRTALYTTGSLLRNKDDTRVTLPGAAGLTTPGDDSKGFEIGVRHFF
ncbi:MAG: porin [Burkholderiales bacterium]|nr:porin [Burkholderiales bacterium]